MRKAAFVLAVVTAAVLLSGESSNEQVTTGLKQIVRPACGTAPRAGCIRGRALAQASWVTVSGDGRNVYVGSVGSNAVDTFARDARTGAVAQLRGGAGCVSQTGAEGCSRGHALRVARPIALSGDGRNLYAGTSDGVAVFARERRTGALRQLPGARGCVAVAALDGCELGRGLSVVRALTVAHDGRYVYVAARGSDALTVFARSKRSGALSQLRGAAGCVSERPAPGCGRGRGLNGGRGVVLSPDQRYLYVAAEDGNSVAVFARSRRTGGLRQLSGHAGCLQRSGADGCARLATLRSPHHLVLTADGRFGYVASDTIGAVVILRRNRRTGTLTPIPGRRGCVASPPRRPCKAVRATRGAHSLALAPGDRVLYVAARNDHAIAVLARDPRTGALAQPPGRRGCIGRTRVAGCAPALGLVGVHSVSVSADGRDVYAVSELDGAVVGLATLGGRCRAATRRGHPC